MIKEIEAFLQNPNGTAADALQLLEDINTPAVMLRICSAADNSFTRTKIRELLTAYLRANATAAKSVAVFRHEAHAQINPSESAAAPPEIQASVRKRKELYGQMRETHARLKMMCYEAHKYTNQDRAKIRQNLQRITVAIDHHWKLAKYYDQHRQLPPPVVELPKVDISDLNNLVKRQTTLRTYLTPSYISRINNPDKTAAHQAELTAIEEKLKHYIPE